MLKRLILIALLPVLALAILSHLAERQNAIIDELLKQIAVEEEAQWLKLM